MPPMTSRGLVLSSLALSGRVFSVRQRRPSATSVVTAVDAISALIQEKHGSAAVHEAIHQISAQAGVVKTPGAEDAFVKAMQEVIGKIDSEVEQKIIAGQKATQAEMNVAFANFDRASEEADQSKDAATTSDKEYFECVNKEQQLRMDADKAEKDLGASRNNEKASCQLQQDARGFSFDGADDYQLSFSCDLSDAEGCSDAFAKLEAAVAKMHADAERALAADEDDYAGKKAKCSQETQARAAAQSRSSKNEHNWRRQHGLCQKASATSRDAMCSFGKKLQAKCKVQERYEDVTAAAQKATEDREAEWQAARMTKCMAIKFQEKGLDEPTTTAEMDACAKEVDFAAHVGRLEKRAGSSQIACAGGPMSFNNGQTWKVPEEAKPRAEDYSRMPFKPVFSLNSGFDVCGPELGENQIGGVGGGPLAPPPGAPVVLPEGTPTLHLIEGDSQCREELESAAIFPPQAAQQTKFEKGATLATWGCDRLTKAGSVFQLKMGDEKYAVSYC